LLLDKEVIFKENVEEIFGKRPWVKEEIEEAKVVETEEAPAPEEAAAEESVENEAADATEAAEGTKPSAE